MVSHGAPHTQPCSELSREPSKVESCKAINASSMVRTIALNSFTVRIRYAAVFFVEEQQQGREIAIQVGKEFVALMSMTGTGCQRAVRSTALRR